MVNEDFRVEWIRQRVCAGFNMPEKHYFDELLSREDGEEKEKILNFLNYYSQEDFSICLLFFKALPEEEAEGKCQVSEMAGSPGENNCDHLAYLLFLYNLLHLCTHKIK